MASANGLIFKMGKFYKKAAQFIRLHENIQPPPPPPPNKRIWSSVSNVTECKTYGAPCSSRLLETSRDNQNVPLHTSQLFVTG
jgi:hypothetical protein